MIWNGPTWKCKCGFRNAEIRTKCRNEVCLSPRPAAIAEPGGKALARELGQLATRHSLLGAVLLSFTAARVGVNSSGEGAFADHMQVLGDRIVAAIHSGMFDPGGAGDPDGAMLIAMERARQVADEGWTAEHDDAEHRYGDLTQAAVAYAEQAACQIQKSDYVRPRSWPWKLCWWKPAPDPIRNLVKAGALIAAEIDRLKREVRQ